MATVASNIDAIDPGSHAGDAIQRNAGITPLVPDRDLRQQIGPKLPLSLVEQLYALADAAGTSVTAIVEQGVRHVIQTAIDKGIMPQPGQAPRTPAQQRYAAALRRRRLDALVGNAR